MPRNHLPSFLQREWQRIPVALLCLGIPAAQMLASSTPVLAQPENDAIRRQGQVNLFDGSSIDLNDLLQAAQVLSNQAAASRWDSAATLDAAVEQFKQSRRPLKLSPGSWQPQPPATP